MSYPESMPAPHLAPDSKSIAMAVSPSGAAAADPDRTKTKRALFKNVSPRCNQKETANTPTTGEKRATRETYIVVLRGCDPTTKPEHIIKTMLEKIEADETLTKSLVTGHCTCLCATSLPVWETDH